MSFSSKNDAESFRNFIKIQFLDPKRAKLVQKFYGKLTESLRNFQDLTRRTHKGPYGPIYVPGFGAWAPPTIGECPPPPPVDVGWGGGGGFWKLFPYLSASLGPDLLQSPFYPFAPSARLPDYAYDDDARLHLYIYIYVCVSSQ